MSPACWREATGSTVSCPLTADCGRRAWRRRRGSFAEKRIDLTVLLPNSLRSALTAWLGGSRRIVGYARYGRTPLLTDALEPDRQADGRLRISPIIDAYNRLVEHVGCPHPGHDLELFTTPADEAAADRVWEQGRLGDYPEVVCLNPGAAFGSSKHWPAEYFAGLARDLVRAARLRRAGAVRPGRARRRAGDRRPRPACPAWPRLAIWRKRAG